MRSLKLRMSVAALLAATACDQGPPQLGDRGADAVAPRKVSAQELQAAVSDPRVRRFYEARGWQAAWNEDDARALTAALREAPRHALEAVQFLKDGDEARDPVAREAALSLAAVSYAEALSNGRVDPKRLFEVYTLPMPSVDVAAGLNAALERGEVDSWLSGLAPQDEEYRALSEAFLRYSKGGGAGGQPIPEGHALKPGLRDPRVPRIAEALRTNGYLQAGAAQEGQPGAANLYTPAMAEAVKKLQADYGETSDGVVGNATLALLNTGAADRARTLAINLERRRWLAREAPRTRIDVNIAAAFLKYMRDGKVIDMRRTVVGQPGDETPQLGSPIFRLVANPNWTVPQGIAEEEILPKGAAYMRANNMVMKDGFVVQAPGPDSALGLVKFDMENDHAIYLHDTPAKALFSTNERHSSHGCVRVHNALQFARMIADHNGAREEFEKALATGKESYVPLDAEIPVRMLYHTAYLDNGRVVFRTDPYGWDDDVARALGMGGGSARAKRTHVSLVGP